MHWKWYRHNVVQEQVGWGPRLQMAPNDLKIAEKTPKWPHCLQSDFGNHLHQNYAPLAVVLSCHMNSLQKFWIRGHKLACMVSNGPKIAKNDINVFWIPDGPILPKYPLYVLWFLLSISIGSKDTKSMLYDSAGIVFAASTNLLDGRFVKELHRHNLRPAAQTASSHQSAGKKWNKISSHLRTLHYHKIIKLRKGTTISSQEQNGFTIHERNQSINLQGEKI